MECAATFATFLASIGACAGTYVLAFCRKRGLPVDGIQVVQAMNTDPTTGMVKVVQLAVHVPPEFPARYHEALVREVEQCTIKKHLETPPRIEITTQVDSRAAAS